MLCWRPVYTAILQTLCKSSKNDCLEFYIKQRISAYIGENSVKFPDVSNFLLIGKEESAEHEGDGLEASDENIEIQFEEKLTERAQATHVLPDKDLNLRHSSSSD